MFHLCVDLKVPFDITLLPPLVKDENFQWHSHVQIQWAHILQSTLLGREIHVQVRIYKSESCFYEGQD